MDITRPLPKCITVLDPKSGVFEQEVIYDWEPEHCASCLQIGQNCKTMNVQKQPLQVQKGKQPKPMQVWRRSDQVLKIIDKQNVQVQNGSGQTNVGKGSDDKAHVTSNKNKQKDGQW